MTHVKFNRKPLEGTFSSLVDDLFNDLPVLFKNEFPGSRKQTAPVNVKETDKHYELEFIAPGFEKTDFNVSVEGNLLTVSAEKKNEVKEENHKNIRREYSFSSFKRSFTIDEKIDATNIAASYINGVLTLNLPKKEEVKAQVKAITIN